MQLNDMERVLFSAVTTLFLVAKTQYHSNCIFFLLLFLAASGIFLTCMKCMRCMFHRLCVVGPMKCYNRMVYSSKTVRLTSVFIMFYSGFTFVTYVRRGDKINLETNKTYNDR